jgi:hypothetical protein
MLDVRGPSLALIETFAGVTRQLRFGDVTRSIILAQQRRIRSRAVA